MIRCPMIKVGICTDSQDVITGGMSPYLAIPMSLLIIVGRQNLLWLEMVSVVLVGANSKNIVGTKWSLHFCTVPTWILRAHSRDHRPQPTTRISPQHWSHRPSFPLFSTLRKNIPPCQNWEILSGTSQGTRLWSILGNMGEVGHRFDWRTGAEWF